MKNVLTNLRNLKSKVDKLDVSKLVPPVNLSKLSDFVKNDVFTKDVYNTKMKKNEDKIHDITNLATLLDAKMNEVKKYLVLLTLLPLLLLMLKMRLKTKYLILLI